MTSAINVTAQAQYMYMCLRPNTSAMKPMKSNWIRAPAPAGVNKKPKKSKLSGMDFGEFKTVWQGESGKIKTVCWFFFKYCLLDFLNFLRCKLIDLTESEKRQILSTFCSMVKFCIDRDNPLVSLLSATPISLCKMRIFPLCTCQSRTSTRCHHCRCPQTMWTWCGRQCLPKKYSSFAKPNTMTRKRQRQREVQSSPP